MSQVLVVTSKIKKHIKAKGLSTSAEAIQLISEKVEEICNDAIEAAKQDKRKTVMARDLN